MQVKAPIPPNELKRIINLADFDLDYAEIQESLGELTHLAAKIAGTNISMINLIDSLTQWTVAKEGIDLSQMSREDSVCQYTILSKEFLEIKDLRSDNRFKDKFYVVEHPKLTYYFGVPLVSAEGYHIGAICVMDQIGKEISSDKIELLKIIALEVVRRLSDIRQIHELRKKDKEASQTLKKVAHDIRGPLSGIVTLAKMTKEDGTNNSKEEMLEVIQMIYTSGNSLLEFAEEIFNTASNLQLEAHELTSNDLNLMMLKDKLQKLFNPQAINKAINFKVNADSRGNLVPFARTKLLQITANLISNAIKFTPEGGSVTVDLDLATGTVNNILRIVVTDTGVGLTNEQIDFILKGTPTSSKEVPLV
jgi:GAF domain-containing protein